MKPSDSSMLIRSKSGISALTTCGEKAGLTSRRSRQ
jgi:hypothetical protein